MTANLIRSSYFPEEVTFLLKDIGALVAEQTTEERERAIQSGVHYSEMLPMKFVPSQSYMQLYHKALRCNAQKVAWLVGVTAELILKNRLNSITLVSLARAGTPVGVLIRRYLKLTHQRQVPHYSISILRGKGIDENAIDYICERYSPASVIFIDGWTGKGAISKVLSKAIERYNRKNNRDLSADLAVLADPGYCAQISATHDDFLIPSACLNSTVSGLVSRTFHRDDIITENDFHGAKFYEDLLDKDLSNAFVDSVSGQFVKVTGNVKTHMDTLSVFKVCAPSREGMKSVRRISKEFGISDINRIKPGIGETTRVLLRRVPWKILVHPERQKLLGHVLQLAEEKGVPLVAYRDMSYACCGLIKQVVG